MAVQKIGYQKAPHSVRAHRYAGTLGVAVKRGSEVKTQADMVRKPWVGKGESEKLTEKN